MSRRKRVLSLSEFVAGKSVSLVGNSARILREKPGNKIDAADVVIRMNRGLPMVTDASAVGSRTTVWATAKYWADLSIPDDCETVLWMKLTKLGEKQRPFMEHQCNIVSTPLLVWSRDYEDSCRSFVGAEPGTGIRLLWWLRMVAHPRHVSCYGMDCWEDVSHWSGRKNTPNHSPTLERQAMLKLL